MDDSPIIGANITIKGDKNTGTISDIDGNFSLSIPDNKTILVVTYIGYKTREVPVEDLGNIKIVLEGDDHTLNEVVVVGSGTQKKVSVTGAITSIKVPASNCRHLPCPTHLPESWRVSSQKQTPESLAPVPNFTFAVSVLLVDEQLL